MVSIGTVGKLAGLGIALGLGYVLIKNAGGIGSSLGNFVGGGLASGFRGLGDSFSNAFDIFGDGGRSGPTPTAQGLPADHQPIPTVDGVNTAQDLIVQQGGIPDNPEFRPIAQGFGDFINSKAITADFAQRFSFQPPAQAGQLDVSNAFAFIAKEDSVENLERRRNSNFGGFGSESAQDNALASAIQESARLHPEFFA